MWKDEENCPETCNTDEEFQCEKEDGNIKCIRIEKKCDGVQDCEFNGEDESDCPCNIIEEFQCEKEDGNTKCIPIEKKCDGVQDCEFNGEDESVCTPYFCKSITQLNYDISWFFLYDRDLYRISSYSFHRNFSFLNLEIVENSNSYCKF